MGILDLFRKKKPQRPLINIDADTEASINISAGRRKKPAKKRAAPKRKPARKAAARKKPVKRRTTKKRSTRKKR